jgi:hypothetical protein
MSEEKYNKSFNKMKDDVKNKSRQPFEILVNNFDRCLELKLSKEEKEDLINSLNNDFYIRLKSKINIKRNIVSGNLAGKKCNRIVLDEIVKSNDNINIKNNTGSINIANDNSQINTSTTVIRKKKYY